MGRIVISRNFFDFEYIAKVSGTNVYPINFFFRKLETIRTKMKGIETCVQACLTWKIWRRPLERLSRKGHMVWESTLYFWQLFSY